MSGWTSDLYFLVSKYLLPEGIVKVGKTMRKKCGKVPLEAYEWF